MRKLFMIVSALILALNLNLFAQPFAQAASNQYDNLANGDYSITAKALNKDSNEPSGAAGFIEESAQLNLSDAGIQLTLTVPKNDMAIIKGMQLEGVEPSVNGTKWTYKITSLKTLLNAQVQYEVPAMDMKHDVPFRFSLEGLDQIPKKQETEVEEPEAEQAPESNDNNQGATEDEKNESPEKEESTEEDQSSEKEDAGKEEEPSKPNAEDDATENEASKTGAYTVDVAYLHASKDEPSSMGRYLSNPVFVTMQNDQNELTIAVNDHKTVTALKVDGKNAISTKVEDNTRYETFKVTSLDEPITAYVEYQAPYQGSVHHGNATFRMDLDTENMKPAKVTDKPGNHISTEQLNLADGLYAINASYINAKNGKDSAMARYLDEQAYISVQDGKAEVYFLINDNETVTKLKINDQNELGKIVNGEKTLVSFGVNPLVTEMTGYAEYQAPFNGQTHYGKAEFNIALNQGTIKKVAQLPIEQEQNKDDGKEEGDESQQPSKQEKPKEENPNATVKGYTIDYMIKHATKEEASAADQFFVKPGVLVKKNGKNYLQVSINNWRMIDWLKVNGQSVTVIEEDQAADTATVQFAVSEDLTDVAQVSMKVNVPGLYETTHEARLVLDETSLVLDESDTEYVVHAPASNDNQPTIEKPSFGSNGSNNSTTSGEGTAGTHDNPQTGDNSKLVFYATLLLVSLGLLTVQYKRRRVNS